MMHLRTAYLLSAILLTAFTSPAFAVDGVILIDQNRALAGNVTPGDTPGFPVTLSQPGSYRLSGNLTVPANTVGILIAASAVTLDLNGFHLTGQDKTGIGIDANEDLVGITVRNGSVSKFINGVDLTNTTGARIEQITAFLNDGAGIFSGNSAIVSDNIMFDNGVGLRTQAFNLVTGNTASRNHADGMQVDLQSTIIGNTVTDNREVGIFLRCEAVIVNNTVRGNGTAFQELGVGCTRANNSPTP